MDIISDSEFAAGFNTCRIDFLNTQQEDFVNSVYSSVDEATERELKRLYVEEGVIPACKPGCYHCCDQHILTNIIEARVLVHYIKHEFSRDQIESLRIRTQQWHEWDETRLGKYRATHINEKFAFPGNQYCPLLVEGKCSAYSMRPFICRTHFVCSDSSACRSSNDPEYIKDYPVALSSILVATNPFSLRVRDHIEKAGLNYYASTMLLPHWLAIEMNWDFAISPKSCQNSSSVIVH